MISRLHVFVISALGVGCGVGQLCDPDQTYAKGVCFGPDAAPLPDAAPSSTDANLQFAHFGDVCVTDMECATPTDFCARLPADPTGYCTQTGCLAPPAICPSGWGCFDLSVLQAGLPTICTKP